MSHIIVLAPSGIIAAYSVNNSGCIHDGQCAEQGGGDHLASGEKGVVDSYVFMANVTFYSVMPRDAYYCSSSHNLVDSEAS